MPNPTFPIIYSDEFLEHLTGRGHPERPERLSAVVSALNEAAFSQQIKWRSPTSIEENSPISVIEEIHSPRYIRKVRDIANEGGGFLDTDTYVSPKSYDVALLAVNAWLDGVDIVLETGQPAFVLSRPPGHHAEIDFAMGFCLFSNAAISAFQALKKPEVNKVAILDWDVHHGNGTQAIVENNPDIAYCSLHQYPCYPGTGKTSEHGINNNVLNLPIPPDSDISIYQSAFEKEVLPFLSNFQPDLLVVSAGYD
ncbi:MAG: histone deacetylase, partial [Cyanobacteria bacterium J06628_3]